VRTLTPEDIRVATTRKICYSRLREQFGFTSLITPEGYSPKTDKGRARGYSTAIMYFAPANLSGYDVCQYRSEGCTASCLNKSGHGLIGLDSEGLNPPQRARIARTKLFFLNRFLFNELLVHEITLFVAGAREKNRIPCVRLNGTADLPWEKLLMNDGRTILEHFPDVQFYDYTKHPERALKHARGEMPANYHLTFSRSETNSAEVSQVLAAGGNVAAVFKICECGPKTACKHDLPEFGAYNGTRVVSGDHDDLRFLDDSGVYVGLKAKGLGRLDTSGFVIDMRDRSN